MIPKSLSKRPPHAAGRLVWRDRPKAKSSDTNVLFPGRSVLTALPAFAYFYVLLILPFIGNDGGPRIGNQIFWPTMAGGVLALVWLNRSFLDRKYIFSLPIMSLSAYLLFSAASIGWAYSPGYAFSRYMAQLFLAIIVVAPYAVPISTAHTPQRLLVYCAIAVAVDAIYVLTTPPGPVGHAGYFTDKQSMGFFCGTVIIISAHEMLFRGWRRLLAIVLICVAVWLLFESKSKGSLAFVLFAFVFAGLILAACKYLRTTPPFVLAAAVLAFFGFSLVTSDPIGSISYHLYGDFTVTGRTYIWDFINHQISRNPWLGWGFHSYFGVPNSPNNEAPGFIRDMPSSHSGYLELKLDTGYIGYFIFLVFIYSSLHSLEIVRRKDPARAWLYMSIACYVILLNLIDSIWIGENDLWILYLIVVAESIRIAQPNRSVSKSGAGGKLMRNKPQSSGSILQKPAIGKVLRDDLG